MKRVSIKNIAEEVGVSTATVSLVLNNKEKDGRISKQMAEKVREAAKVLNYRPNTAARSLRTGKTKTIGLVVADISNSFFSRLARTIENVAGEMGYQVMFGSSDESASKFKKLIDLFVEKYVDGIIVAPPVDSESTLIQLVNNDIPVVLVDRAIPSLPIGSVQIDNVSAAYILTKQLISQNRKRIGFIGYEMKLSNIQDRLLGYKKALMEADIEIDESLICSANFNKLENNINLVLESLLTKKIDSIVFATNRVGIQSLLLIKKKGIQSKMKFACIDNPDEYKLSDIPIICIEQPVEELGKRVLDLLFRKMTDPSYKVVENITLQANVVEKE